jgi:outer membrane protein OmpA-like peptidoglycan-associated protein
LEFGVPILRFRSKVLSIGLTAGKGLRIGSALLILFASGCARKHVPQASPLPPPAKPTIVVLLPDPDRKPGEIEVKNTAGAQSINQPYQAVQIERPDVLPSKPFTMEQAEVRRRFGAAMDVLPVREVRFTLYFKEGTDALIPESEAQLPAIFAAIEERHSTEVTVTGHTDMTGNPTSNYQLGMKRAQRVADILINKGMNASNLFTSSHGEADPIVKTPRGVAEQRNRRVEVIIR